MGLVPGHASPSNRPKPRPKRAPRKHSWLTTGYSWLNIAHSWLIIGHSLAPMRHYFAFMGDWHPWLIWVIICHSWAFMHHYWASMGDYQSFMDDYHACIFPSILACIEREARCIDAPAEGPRANLSREITSGSEGRTLGAT